MLINLLEGPSSGEIHLFTNLLKRTERLIHPSDISSWWVLHFRYQGSKQPLIHPVILPSGGPDMYGVRAVNNPASIQGSLPVVGLTYVA